MPGTLFVVATPIGNLEDVSARSLRILREVAVIAAEDTRRTAHLLDRFAIATPSISFNSHNEGHKAEALIERLLAGDSVALVSDAGTPTVSDPGSYLVGLAVKAGIRVEPVPGPSAVTTLLAAAALPTDEFCFLGFPPTKTQQREIWFRRLSDLGMTVVFFEAPHRLASTLEQIRLIYGDCHIVVGRELTKVHEEIVRGTITETIRAFDPPMGEFSVALNLAIQQIDAPQPLLSAKELTALVEDRRQIHGHSKRRAIAEVARTVGLTPNALYEIVTGSKKSVK